MQHDPVLSAWEAFYVIAGSSAAALTGLQFVVIALVAERRKDTTHREIDAFATPTVVHFGAVLLLSGIISAPWHGVSGAAALIGIVGLAGLIYAVVTVLRARHQTAYQPVLEDWIFHGALPVIAYGALVGAALTLPRHSTVSLFVVGGAALLLMFIGIHNAWDTVAWFVVQPPPAEGANETRS